MRVLRTEPSEAIWLTVPLRERPMNVLCWVLFQRSNQVTQNHVYQHVKAIFIESLESLLLLFVRQLAPPSLNSLTGNVCSVATKASPSEPPEAKAGSLLQDAFNSSFTPSHSSI